MPTISISPIPIYNVRIFLLQVDQKAILIDAGIPFTETRVYQRLRSRGVDPSQLQTILLTHGHLDHIGCLANLKQISGADVVCHRSLAKTLSEGLYEEAIPRSGPWKFMIKPASILLGTGIKPVQADFLVDGTLDLVKFGLHGQMIHTPGHSPGSCSILLDGGICFLGDLLRETSPGQYDTGLFYHNRDQILASLQEISGYRPEIIYLSHGTTMTGKDLDGFLERNAR